MNGVAVPLWTALPAALLLIGGSLLILMGLLDLLKFNAGILGSGAAPDIA